MTWRDVLSAILFVPCLVFVDRLIAPRFLPEFFSIPIAALIVLVMYMIGLVAYGAVRIRIRRLRSEGPR